MGWKGPVPRRYHRIHTSASSQSAAEDLDGTNQALGRFADLYATGHIPEYHNIVDTIIAWGRRDPGLPHHPRSDQRIHRRDQQPPPSPTPRHRSRTVHFPRPGRSRSPEGRNTYHLTCLRGTKYDVAVRGAADHVKAVVGGVPLRWVAEHTVRVRWHITSPGLPCHYAGWVTNQAGPVPP